MVVGRLRAGARPHAGRPAVNLEAEWRIPVLQRAYGRLGERVRLIQYDGRGTGRSQRDVDDVSLEADLRDLDRSWRRPASDEVVLFGFYHSAMSAVAWAARHPDRVRGLVLFGGGLRGWDLMRGPGTQALLSLIDRDWDTFVESVTHAWLGWPGGEEGRLAAEVFRTSTSPAIAKATLQAAGEIDVSDAAPLVQAPAIVVHRRDATVIPLDVSRALADALPQGRLEVIDGRSATMFFEGTDEVVDLLVRFTLDPSMSAALARSPRRGTHRSIGELSPREREVLRLIAAGEIERSDRRAARDLDQHRRAPRQQPVSQDRCARSRRRHRVGDPQRGCLTAPAASRSRDSVSADDGPRGCAGETAGPSSTA